jgi:hypothetical protein
VFRGYCISKHPVSPGLEHVDVSYRPPKEVVSAISYDADVNVQFTLLGATKASKSNVAIV